MDDDKAIAKVLIVLSSAYPRFELTEPTIRIYEELLADIPTEILQLAAKAVISESIFFPAVAELRKKAFEVMSNQQSLPSAFEAWAEVRRYLSDGRGHPIVRHSKEWDIDPLFDKVVGYVGGWTYLATSENQAADRARFIQAYEATVQREQEGARMLPQVRELTAQLADSRRLVEVDVE